MNSRAQDLALRKEVLLARSALCRLKIRYQVHALRLSVSWRGAGVAAAGASPARAAVFLLAAEGVGRDRMARWLRFAARALAIARMASLALGLLRTPPADPAGRQPP